MIKSRSDFKKTILAMAISLLCFFAMAPLPRPVFASVRGLYVIADINPPMAYNPIHIYDIQPAPNYLVYQTTLYAPNHHPGTGAVDLTIDSDSQTLFITCEYTNIIQLMNATTFADLGTARAPEAKNLAGIVYDHDKKLVYTVDRITSDLYVFEWNSSAHALTFESHVNLTHTSEAWGIALDETNDILYVADGVPSDKFDWYAADTWTHLGTKVTTHPVIGIAVDANNGFIYTSAWEYDQRLIYGLYKYDTTTDKETVVLNGTNGKYAQMLAVEVDANSSLVYATTYNGGSAGYNDVLIVFDSNLNELWRSGDMGNPTGIAISMRQVPYIYSGSSTIEYWLAAILSLAGVLAALGIFYAFKHKKRGGNQIENRRLAFCSNVHICHPYIRGVYRLLLDPSFHSR